MKSRFLLYVFVLLITNNWLLGQNLLESRQTSYYTYIYKITNKEAKKVYKNDHFVIDDSYFHTVVDSFPTGKEYEGMLQPGHYVKAYAEENSLNVKIAYIPDFDVKILNNNTDLCIQVFDLEGNLIQDAKVKIGIKRIRFDEKSGTYLLKKSNRKGLLQVKYNGKTGYFDLNRQYNNPAFMRTFGPVINSFPLRIIWRPVVYFVRLPFDGIASIIKWKPYGTISLTKWFFQRTFYKLSDFGYYYYDFIDRIGEYAERKNLFGMSDDKYKGYLVFNKPKYKPGETVKLKAFITDRKGKPLNEELSLFIEVDRKRKHLSKISPYSKGGYEYEFLLHDSLDLKLDRSYKLLLYGNRGSSVFSNSFKYEDYELSKLTLNINTKSENHFRGTPFNVAISGKDVNDLNIPDGRLEVLVFLNKVNNLFDERVFISDTLLFTEIPLNPSKETEVMIPDSIFPNANIDYTILVTLLTSDNERIIEEKRITYYHSRKEIELSLLNDSISLDFLENGIRTEKEVSVFAYDNFRNEMFVGSFTTPAKIVYNSFYSEYVAKADGLKGGINISNESPMLRVNASRTYNSLNVLIDNPRNIDFTYNIYKKDKEIERGFSKSLNISRKASVNYDYFVSIRYIWGGNVKEENYRVRYNNKKLNVTVKEPGLIFPGQSKNIDILVTDHKGNPVEGVDLTAFSITSKFDYNQPVIPDFNKERKNKKLINNFSFKEFKAISNNRLKLNYEQWNEIAQLDSIEYYKFIYPKNGFYVNSFKSPDSITQFSPFVFIDGEMQPVQVIYIDNVPVYFRWSTNSQPYSFRIDPRYRKIRIRTAKHNITFDNFYFNEGEKTIFCINPEEFNVGGIIPEKVNFGMNIQKTKPFLSKSEKYILSKYVFPYKYNFGDRYAYLNVGQNVILLEPKNRSWYTDREIQYAGPVSGLVDFTVTRNYSHRFNHESFYEYDFGHNYIKMRSIDKKSYPMHFDESKQNISIYDYVLTKEKLQQAWLKSLESKRYTSTRTTYPQKTEKGYGSLHFDIIAYKNDIPLVPINSILLSYDDPSFIRVYPGNYSIMHQLEQGKYSLILVYHDSKYFMVEDIEIKRNGKSFLSIKNPELITHENFTKRVSEILNESVLDDYNSWIKNDRHNVTSIQNIYREEFSYYGPGRTVQGYVYDSMDDSSLPGVSVVIKGTTFGTITDINGFYSINVPSGHNTLIFSFLGYKTEEVEIGYRNRIDITMNGDICALQEVVVVGYGIQKKQSMTGSISTMHMESEGLFGQLSGVAAGISISGAPNQINIRGMSSIESSDSPLIIVDGVIFTGDLSSLSAEFIEQIQVLKGETAASIYGSRALGGVVIITSKSGSSFIDQGATDKGEEFDEMFLEAMSAANSLRSNFSDYAFWQPKLTTNKDGLASFEATFPDDITSWKTHYLAMNGKKQSGQTSGTIRSYKPVMAQLSLPRFLIQSDTAFAIGKVVNYMNDSVEVKSNLYINDENVFSVKRYCRNSIVDSLKLIALNDSIKVKYTIETESGYFDGEQRSIEVYPIGLEETIGDFFVMSKDTIVGIDFVENAGKAKIYARADVLNVLDMELKKLVNYKHLCNEQVASRLKALLMQKRISDYKGEKFKLEKDVDKAIERLMSSRTPEGTWGWWKDSESSYWISWHVVEALAMAEKEGYIVKWDKNLLAEHLIWILQKETHPSLKLRILYILRYIDPKANLDSFANAIAAEKGLSFNQMLQVMEIQQFYNKDLKIDTLFAYQKSTLFGNVFFADRESDFNLLDNEIQNTLIAYRILRNSTSDYDSILPQIRNYFFEIKRSGSWRNTYESSLIIETILPELIKSGPVEKPKLVLGGDVNITVEEFPFEIEINPTSKITIEKTGTYPVYITGYQQYWNTEPEVKTNDFEIVTYFDDTDEGKLTAGKSVKLIAKVNIKKDADYVMISIPIPAGCSYGDKPGRLRNESHREYFRHETVIYCERLRAGIYTFEINLLPRYTGNYVLNPAKVELMYFPLFNANNELKRIEIK